MSKKSKKALTKKDKALIKKLIFENLKKSELYDIHPEQLADVVVAIFKKINRD